MSQNTLTIVGSGIKFMSHLTIEVKTSIEKSDMVLYLINEPVMEEWIKDNSKASESLEFLYTQNEKRSDNYLSIANYVIEKLSMYKALCLVMYGHPTVFVDPTLHAVTMAKDKGFNVKVLPGISAEDCLFADLLIDPGTVGCQSYEATDFMLYRREYDSCSHLILWQPYVIGKLGVSKGHNPKAGLKLLTSYLLEKYDPSHEIIIYEAAQYGVFHSRIDTVKLAELPDANVTGLSTLYIRPKAIKNPDPNILASLKDLK